MSNIKKFNEHFSDSEETNEDEYLKSTEYFVETYYNGQFGQLRRMLKDFKEDDRMEELLNHLNEIEKWEIKDWIIVNL